MGGFIAIVLCVYIFRGPGDPPSSAFDGFAFRGHRRLSPHGTLKATLDFPLAGAGGPGLERLKGEGDRGAACGTAIPGAVPMSSAAETGRPS